MCFNKSIYHVNINVDLMEENLYEINDGIMINVDVNVKNLIYLKKIMFGILPHVIVKMKKMASIMDNLVIMYVEVIE